MARPLVQVKGMYKIFDVGEDGHPITSDFKESFKRHTDIDIEVYNNAYDAIRALKYENMIFCTGSLYLVADINAALNNNYCKV